MFNRLWGAVLSAGDILGKLLTLITLPAVFFAGIAYAAEIRDLLTSADVTATIEKGTLRCNYVWRDPAALRRYTDGDKDEFTKLCSDSPLAISFEVSIRNNDSITREVESLRIRADGKLFGGLTFDRVQQINHQFSCLLYTSPSPRDQRGSRMPSSA